MEFLRPALVLLFSLALFLALTFSLRVRFSRGWRFSVLAAFVLLGGLTWFITEALSLINAITLIGMAAAWGIAAVIIFYYFIKTHRESGSDFLQQEFARMREMIRSLPRGYGIALIYLALIGLVLGVITFTAAPNTFDSMTYHLSRVMHWIQDQNLSFFPTANQRQIHLSPMAEISILNYQILAGNDTLANSVQYFAMLGSLLGVSLLAKLLGGNIKTQVFTGLAAVTLPMGLLQATSTQNDYVMSLYLIGFTAFTLLQIQEGSSPVLFVLSGLSLGLAINTKLTAVLYAAPIGIWLAIHLFLHSKAQAWKPLVVIVSTALIIIAPISLRNYRLYGNPLGPESETVDGKYKYTNDLYTLPVLASNILRNLSLQLGLPNDAVNLGLQTAITDLHTSLGLDPSDPRTTWTSTQFEVFFSLNEASAGNFLHFIFIAAAGLLLFRFRDQTAAIYTACLALGFLLFCFLLKCQPWNSRLFLPLFVLALPMACVVLARFLDTRAQVVLMLILSIGAIPYVFFNPTRPLFGAGSIFRQDRLHQYFATNPEIYAPYLEVMQKTADLKCGRIALISHENNMDYPLWMAARSNGQTVRIENILVNNPSQNIGLDFSPCVIISTYQYPKNNIPYQGKVFVRSIDTPSADLFIPSDTP